MTNSLEVSRDGDVVTVTLNRSEAGNSLDRETARALHKAVEEAEATGALVMVIAAHGKVFCAGGDVASMARAGDPAAHVDALVGELHEALAAMSHSRVFVIAAIDGAAAGGGLGLALTADYLVATPRASFLTAYSGVGLTPDSGVSSLLVRSVGLHRALALATSGRVLSAEEAREWGFVAEVVTSEELEATVATRAQGFADRVGPALGETKRLVRSAAETGYLSQLADEQRTISKAAGTTHAQECIRGFVDRSRNTRT
ncbi:enoyl-CoA hydratase/isomerase family protein [Pseudarthrobacter sp. fls2-241-R2A-168]|jgi:2-(1,2-epoxy-1,2-dihydrophenyl)acetyl-CoA isomerase|uniref:enoyl-CoA hydratase/isomerase family protein n=1 Tax=Pseudarthrobacter sp. fls2-241-R2A-168 TaxID=3040304 RepID=UPI0025562CC4|nr:enoyl-CoA hydratase/isomerase family protein [Pseudarthrobacter sp. fls2-241-R2A-168]